MGVLADRLDRMRIRVTSPNGKITAELYDRTAVRLSFAPGSYRWYSERTMERQLAGLGRVLWANRMKGYYQALSEAFGATVTRESTPVTQRDLAYAAARDTLVAEGRSPDGQIRITVRGMREWTIRITDGTLDALPERRFAAGVEQAASELILDQFAKVRQLKDHHYGER